MSPLRPSQTNARNTSQLTSVVIEVPFPPGQATTYDPHRNISHLDRKTREQIKHIKRTFKSRGAKILSFGTRIARKKNSCTLRVSLVYKERVRRAPENGIVFINLGERSVGLGDSVS